MLRNKLILPESGKTAMGDSCWQSTWDKLPADEIKKLQLVLARYQHNPTAPGQLEEFIDFFLNMGNPNHPGYDEKLSDLIDKQMGLFQYHFGGLYYSSYLASCYASLCQQIIDEYRALSLPL